MLNRNSFRVLAGFFLLGAMVLVNSYSGIVISSLTVPKLQQSIDSLEELAESKEVGVLLRYDTSIGEKILVFKWILLMWIPFVINVWFQQQATSGVYKAVADKARKFPDHVLGDPFKLNVMLETGHYAYPFVSDGFLTR